MNKAFEKILNKLEENKQILLKSNIKDAYIGIDNAKEIVKEVAEEYNNGWIPCSERLPEESLDSVIGWDAYRERCVFAQYLGAWKLGDWESVNITHWMNVPEQPKESD